MTTTPAQSRPRWPGAIPAAWALATLAILLALQGAPGVSRDEAAVFGAADRGLALVHGAEPPLASAVAGVAHAAGPAVRIPHLRAYRLGSALAGAALSFLLAASALALGGPGAAALAPALFWLAPRTLHAGLVATGDLLLAALALAAVLAFRRARAMETPGRRGWTSVAAGVLLGAAVLARADAWTLAVPLAVYAAAGRVLDLRSQGSPRGAGLASLATAVAAAALAVAAAWPGVLRSGAAPWRAPQGGALSPALALAAIPAPLLLAFAAGLAYAVAGVALAVRAGGADARRAWDGEALLVLAALAALAGSALAHAPPGARPFLHALPFLALLAARALVRAAELAWPARMRTVLAALALLVLYPGLRATVHAFPDGAAAWNELVGGAAGAASRGLRRQDGGEAAAALLDDVNARAAPGARVWWPGVAPEAVALYARDGLVRRDLAAAAGPEEADIALVPLDGGSRDAEYRAWTALRTARPAAGVYMDEVPLAFAYARAGAWR